MEKKIDIDTVERSAGMAADLLKALGNEKRLLALCKLCDGEKNVGEMMDFLGISQSAMSQHLTYLRQKGLVKTRKEGTKIFYSLHDHPVKDFLSVLCRIYKQGKAGNN